MVNPSKSEHGLCVAASNRVPVSKTLMVGIPLLIGQSSN